MLYCGTVVYHVRAGKALPHIHQGKGVWAGRRGALQLLRREVSCIQAKENSVSQLHLGAGCTAPALVLHMVGWLSHGNNHRSEVVREGVGAHTGRGWKEE